MQEKVICSCGRGNSTVLGDSFQLWLYPYCYMVLSKSENLSSSQFIQMQC